MITDFDLCLDIYSGKTKHPQIGISTPGYTLTEIEKFEKINDKADIWRSATVLTKLMGEELRMHFDTPKELQELAKLGKIRW